MLRGVAPVTGRAARPTATSVELVSAEELESGRAESKAGIRAADRTHERPGQGRAPSNQRNRRPAEVRHGQTLRVTTSFFPLATSDKLAQSNHCLQLANTTHTEHH